MLHKPFNLLTIDLSMFGEGAAATAAPAGEGSAPAAAAAPATPEVRYGKQPEQTAAPQQQTQTTETKPTEAPDKAKQFRDMIRGEFKDQYAKETQQLINRRFRETDERIKSMQPIIGMLDKRYGTGGDMAKLMSAIESDRAYWQEAADEAGMTVEQFQTMKRLEAQNDQLKEEQQQFQQFQQSQQQEYMAQMQFRKWDSEAEALKQKYPDFDLAVASKNDMFRYLLRSGNYPMEAAYEAAFNKELAEKAAANAQKAVTDNIRARGSRPQEAGTAATPAFTVKDDVSKLTGKEVLDSFNRILKGERITFSR